MSVFCNRWLCAIVLVTVGGFLITLPGSTASATASSSQLTTVISGPTNSARSTLSTTLPSYVTTGNGVVTTQGKAVSTTTLGTPLSTSTDSSTASSTLSTTTKTQSTENVFSTKASTQFSTESYSTILTTESRPQTSSKSLIISTEGLTTPSYLTTSSGVSTKRPTTATPDTSTDHASTEPLSTRQVSTSNDMVSSTQGDETSSIPHLSTDQDTSTATEMVTSLATSTNLLETQFTSTESDTPSSAQTSMSSPLASLNTPEGLTTSLPEHETTTGSTSSSTDHLGTQFTFTETSAQTSMSSLSASSNTPEGLTTSIQELGTTTGSISTSTDHLETRLTSAKSNKPTSAQTSMSSLSASSNTPEGLTTSIPELGTTKRSIMTSSFRSITDGATSPSPKQTPSPFYPAPTLAVIDSDEAVKKIKIEIAISQNSSKGCDPNNSSSCVEFKDDVETEFEKYYREIVGYSHLEITELKPGSIIVVHQVIYMYSKMKPEDKGLSPEDIYDRTIGPGVDSGTLGELKVSPCKVEDCEPPLDLTDLCKFKDDVECDDYMDAECIGGYIYCASPCIETSFCSSNGDCLQEKGSPARCSCDPIDNGFYFGDHCEKFFNQKVTIICIAIGGGFILGIMVACVVTRCRRKKPLGRYRQYYMDDMGEEGYLCRNESYALEGEEDLIDLTADDTKLEFTFDSPSTVG